jgi:hypothetical protein
MRAATGYRLVVPPGWVQVPVRDATADTAHQVIATAFRHPPDGIPRDKFTQARIELERRLSKMISDARRNGGLELFLAFGHAYETPVPASFLVAEGSLGEMSAEDPLAVVTTLVADSEASRMTALDGAPAVRCEFVQEPDQGKDAGYPSLRVDYTVAVPGEEGRWLVITFSTLGAGDPAGEYARLLAELFDAIMSTFRWTSVQTDSAAG